MNYYNENDPKAAAWLRELIKRDLIAPGEVDERDIRDIRPDELGTYAQCHFFAGIGVWSYALRQAGWPDDRPVWTGSCPCQPFSAAGQGRGTADERHLWPAWFHLLDVCRPEHVFGEQVASKDGLAWFDTVHTDLEGAGYAVGAVDLCAAGVGAPHIRQRLWFVAERVADHSGTGLEVGRRIGGDAREECQAVERGRGTVNPSPTNGYWRDADWIGCRDGKWRPVEPGLSPLAHVAPERVGRLRGYGNAIVAPVAQAFIEAYLEA